jgi:hypothetical protein
MRRFMSQDICRIVARPDEQASAIDLVRLTDFFPLDYQIVT